VDEKKCSYLGQEPIDKFAGGVGASRMWGLGSGTEARVHERRRDCGCRGEASWRRVKARKPALDPLRSDWGRSGLEGEKGNEGTGWQRGNQGDGCFYIVMEMDVESGWRAYLVKKGNKKLLPVQQQKAEPHISLHQTSHHKLNILDNLPSQCICNSRKSRNSAPHQINHAENSYMD
jgi:hypothetical protein